MNFTHSPKARTSPANGLILPTLSSKNSFDTFAPIVTTCWVVVVAVAEDTDVVSTPRTQNAPRSLFSFFTSNSISSRPRRICSSCLVNFCFFSILLAIFFGSLQYPLFLPSLYDMISVLGTKEYAWLRCSYLQPYQKTRCVMGRPFSWAWVGILYE